MCVSIDSRDIFLLSFPYAYLTNVRPLASMEFTMRHQVPLERERTSTLLTHERTVTGVNTQVSQQVMLQREAFLALAALIRTLGCVQ